MTLFFLTLTLYNFVINSIGSGFAVCLASSHYLTQCRIINRAITRWRHQMETFFALLALCAGNSPAIGEFPSQRPMMRRFDVFFDLGLNKQLSKQSWRRWFVTPSRLLWRHCIEVGQLFQASICKHTTRETTTNTAVGWSRIVAQLSIMLLASYRGLLANATI